MAWPCDYILKPLNKKQFINTIAKVKDLLDKSRYDHRKELIRIRWDSPVAVAEEKTAEKQL